MTRISAATRETLGTARWADSLGVYASGSLCVSILPPSRVNAVAETVATLGKGYRAIGGNAQLVTDGSEGIRAEPTVRYFAAQSQGLVALDAYRPAGSPATSKGIPG